MLISSRPPLPPVKLPTQKVSDQRSGEPPQEPENKPCALRRAAEWVMDRTEPQPDTAGNYHSAPYAPSILEGAIEGFALRGVAGGVTSMACAGVSVFIQDKVRSRVLGNLIAAGVSAGTGAALAALTWPAATPAGQLRNVIAGGLLGAFQTYRSDKLADVRGAGGFGTLAAGVAGTIAGIPLGASKVAAGIGGALGAVVASDKPGLKLLCSAAVGGAFGAGLAALGFAPLGIAAMAAVSAVGAAAGSAIGPRYSQFFRNLSKDVGTAAERLAQKVGIVDKPLNPRLRNSLGAVPSGALKEGVNGLVYADGNLIGLAAGVLMEAAHQVSVFMFAHMPEGHAESAPKDEKPTPPPSS